MSTKFPKQTRYVADAYYPKERPYQIWTQYDLRQMSYGCLTRVAMATKFS